MSAKAGDTCRACGATLVKVARSGAATRLPAAEPAASGDPGAAAPLALDLVDLGERTGAPPLATRPDAPTPAPAPEPLVIQAPPMEAALELDADWQREKAERKAEPRRVARHVAQELAARSSGARVPWLLIVIVAGGLCAGGYYLMTRKSPSAPSTPTSTSSVPKRGVTIRIVGKPGTPVTIDGAAAGKTPISLERSAGSRPITVTTSLGTFQVVPDRDQTVDITAPP